MEVPPNISLGRNSVTGPVKNILIKRGVLMSQNRLSEFLFNPSNINTSECDDLSTDELLERIQPFHFHREKLHRTIDENESYLIRDADYRIMEIIESLKTLGDGLKICENLVQLKRRLPESSLDMRPRIISEFASFLSASMQRFNQSKKIFHAALEVLIALKKDLDARDQSHAALVKAEWVEMEKAIYQVTMWENQLEPLIQ